MTARPDRVLHRLRWTVVGSCVPPLVLLAAVVVTEPAGGPDWIAGAAAILGAVAPATGYRLYQGFRDRALADATGRIGRFEAATVLALVVTGSGALLGVAAYAYVGRPESLIGVATHLLLAGAVWPTPERLETFGIV